MDIAMILSKNYSGSEWILDGEDYSSLIWLSDTPKPSEKELIHNWADVKYQIEFDAVRCARHAAYISPNGCDALYMKYQRGEIEKQEWLDAVQAVKDANPYPVRAS
jgi:hypothetical protein